MSGGADAAPAISVPFVDLGGMNMPLKARILADISSVVDEGAFVNGAAVARFEREFAAWCGSSHCVGLSNGLDALRLALIAAGARPGEEVIVPANTFVASVAATSQAGCTPVLVDAAELDYNIDTAAAAGAVTERTRFLMPVHLYGQLADMTTLLELARRHDLLVVEDAAQAPGATRDGLMAGTTGLVGCFSFYPSKNLGAFGDAGAAVTADGSLASRLRTLREYGQSRKHRHDVEGYNARLDTIQATALIHKLTRIDAWNDRRRAAALYLSESLDGLGDLVTPPVAPDSQPVWHLYVVRTGDPSALARHLGDRGVGTGRHYPQPIHLTPAYERLGYTRGAFPVTEELAAHGLSLPMFPTISEPQLEAVVAGVRSYFAGRP